VVTTRDMPAMWRAAAGAAAMILGVIGSAVLGSRKVR
jgi:formate dehydrogenase iron-sulfur subunit